MRLQINLVLAARTTSIQRDLTSHLRIFPSVPFSGPAPSCPSSLASAVCWALCLFPLLVPACHSAAFYLKQPPLHSHTPCLLPSSVCITVCTVGSTGMGTPVYSVHGCLTLPKAPSPHVFHSVLPALGSELCLPEFDLNIYV